MTKIRGEWLSVEKVLATFKFLSTTALGKQVIQFRGYKISPISCMYTLADSL